jgi:serine/threonine protein kinase
MRDETEPGMMRFGMPRKYRGQQIGNYKIIQCIGEGRYGICFLAEDHRGRRLILKKLKLGFFNRNSPKNTSEIKILSELCHPGIPKLFGIVNEKGFYGPVLELKCGDTVEYMLFKQKHRFSNSEIFNTGKQLIEIIKYLHEKGIVHRDIRIPNVLVNGGMVSLVDFGLARWEDRKRYTRDIDFSYLGDFLLYLLYSAYQKKKHQKNRPWYEELSLSPAQQAFLKRLLKLAAPYGNIDEIAGDFQAAFADNGFIHNMAAPRIFCSHSPS